MQNSPENNPPLWAKAVGLIVLIGLPALALAVLIPLVMRLIAWAWTGVS
jgi:hypothetical protein